MLRYILLIFSILFTEISFGQLLIGRDTAIVVKENTNRLIMPWANGINSSNISNIDLNFDGKKDIVVFDKPTGFSPGRFRCFINTGTPGQIKYISNPDLSYLFPPASDWAVLHDYNCDSMEDVFCSANGEVKVYKNISSVSAGINFVLVTSAIQSDFAPGFPNGVSSLYASSIGVPGIADIDGDGDLDILTFSSAGSYVEYHKNLSKETYFTCDSLVYELESSCWGKMTESSCSVLLNDASCNPRPFPLDVNPLLSTTSKRHAGSCLTCLDGDNDGDQDLIMGDIGCSVGVVQYLYNGGSSSNALITDTTMQYPNYPNKNNTQKIRMHTFACTYYVDCDNDGKKDLVATPNVYASENTTSLWYYKNTSTTNTVNFQFVKNNFLQDEMIEVGQNSYPVVFDYDCDGKKDLLIGNWGYFINDTLRSKLTLYRNVGSTAQPSYSLISRDYANIGAKKLTCVMPTIGDIDGDNDDDLLIGTSSGQIHWVENTAGAGNTCNFSIFKNNPFNFTTTSASAAPQLFNIDGDLLPDLMIGGKNGRIAYYKNIGTTTVPAFTLITNSFGAIDVKGNPQIYGIDGYAVPYFYKSGISTKLLVGNVAGQIFHYDLPSVITNSCNLINATTNNINEGGQATICFEDINNDGKRDLFVGNGSGGLSFFSSINQFVGVVENDPATLNDHISLYPNPVNDNLNITINGVEFENGKLTLYDLLGKEAEVLEITSNTQAFLLDKLNSGVYFAKINLTHNSQTVSVTKKIIIN
ncbi:MAG: T9SS type A sorting domain-containing protein [Bacteroidia bacterium]